MELAVCATRNARRRDARDAGTDKDTAEDNPAKRQPSHHPHTQSHALRALLILAAAPAADSTGCRASFCPLCTAFYSRCKRTSQAKFPFPLKKLPPGNAYDVARWRMSLKVAEIINMKTIFRAPDMRR